MHTSDHMVLHYNQIRGGSDYSAGTNNNNNTGPSGVTLDRRASSRNENELRSAVVTPL